MSAKIIGYTQPHEFDLPRAKQLDTLDNIIAYCARVSNPSNQNNTYTVDGLLKYLLKHSHFSPFEMVSVTMEVETTRDIARQMLRHRSFSFQEFSQRYADPTKDLDFVIREARLQDAKNRQNSIETDDDELQRLWAAKQDQIITIVKNHYNWAIASGIAKEQARVILPEGNIVSRLYVAGTIRSWIHYIQIRTDVSTQKEHRDLAEECAMALLPIFSSIKTFTSEQEINYEKSHSS